MYPYAEQILGYKAANPDERIGGLILEVKGDFCRKVKQILERHGRGEDYIEISLDSEFRYNPLHNDLDAYALAFSIASLLNNLFGRGKEPFWQQAYTNLVKFVILLHKVAYDYVTLFNVYECAISPPLLDQRIQEAEEIVMGRHFVAVPTRLFGERAADLAGWAFSIDRSEDCYVAEATPELRELLRSKRHSLRAAKRSRSCLRRSGQTRAAGSREEVVHGGLATHRAEAAHLNRRRHFRLSLPVRRQPQSEARLLPETRSATIRKRTRETGTESRFLRSPG